MKKSRIYTRTGDQGMTSLVGGERVSKTDIRLEAYGTIDELNSHIGLLMAFVDDEDHRSLLYYIQNKLFTVGSYLATDPSFTSFRQESLLSQEAIEKIEQTIDVLDAQLPALTNFVLPSGSTQAAQAHICRCVCRRAERGILQLAEVHEVDEKIIQFVNRLSDYFFVFARKCNIEAGIAENFWDKSCM